MANICICEIRASGPQGDVDEVKRLLDANTEFLDGEEVTSFSEIVGRQLHRSLGFRGHVSEGLDGIIWIGELNWSPPSEFVEEMSRRFSDTTFAMKFSVLDDGDRIQNYEYKAGDSRLIYEADSDFEFRGHDATPVDHWRGSMRFNSLAESEGVMKSLRSNGLIFDMDGRVCSKHSSEDVSRWIENRFPEIVVRINWWLPFCRLDGRSPEHTIAPFEFRDELAVLSGHAVHNWSDEGF